ncbi:MAG TPA: acyl-CoA dehydrogenase family protein, partial [Erythrobacter sp.]|nr:acyl-CoA dehydrogenase family protein [Erythrobacter sp.]
VSLFPAESLALLAESGLHCRFAPTEAGGERFASEEARNAAMMAALGEVGAGDLSVGRLYEGHINALLLFDWYASPGQLEWLRAQLKQKTWFGVWASEPLPGVRIEGGAQSCLTGAKSFASGAGGIDWALVTANREGEQRRLVIIRANDPERADLSGWRVRGMRASVSGTYDCTGIEITDDSLVGQPGEYDREPRFTAGAWRFCAVQLGGIDALIEKTALSMHCRARADTTLRQRFAKAYIAARSARFWVQEAAHKAAREARDAITTARIARGVVEDAGLLAIETAARVLGTRSAFDGERVDKIARDLSLYLRQAGPDYARDEAAKEILAQEFASEGDVP